MFGGIFWVLDMRLRVQKLLLLTAADVIDQKNQLREVAQWRKYSKKAAEVEVTTFLGGKSILRNFNHISNILQRTYPAMLQQLLENAEELQAMIFEVQAKKANSIEVKPNIWYLYLLSTYDTFEAFSSQEEMKMGLYKHLYLNKDRLVDYGDRSSHAQ